jgi:hypothetical protein
MILVIQRPIKNSIFNYYSSIIKIVTLKFPQQTPEPKPPKMKTLSFTPKTLSTLSILSPLSTLSILSPLSTL